MGGSTLAYVKCLEAWGRWCNLFKFLFYCCSVYKATSSRLSTFEFGVILVIIFIYIAVSIVWGSMPESLNIEGVTVSGQCHPYCWRLLHVYDHHCYSKFSFVSGLFFLLPRIPLSHTCWLVVGMLSYLTYLLCYWFISWRLSGWERSLVWRIFQCLNPRELHVSNAKLWGSPYWTWLSTKSPCPSWLQ